MNGMTPAMANKAAQIFRNRLRMGRGTAPRRVPPIGALLGGMQGAPPAGAPPPQGFAGGSGNVLSAKARQNLPRSSFALPGQGSGPKGAGSGSYPIPDISHARNALARVSQHGSPAQKAKVRAAVHRKYPSINMS